jgi:hypothetical protein
MFTTAVQTAMTTYQMRVCRRQTSPNLLLRLVISRNDADVVVVSDASEEFQPTFRPKITVNRGIKRRKYHLRRFHSCLTHLLTSLFGCTPTEHPHCATSKQSYLISRTTGILAHPNNQTKGHSPLSRLFRVNFQSSTMCIVEKDIQRNR